MRKRIGSLLLSLALCLNLLPTAAMAEEAQPTEPLPGEQLEQVQPVPEEPEENEKQPQQDEDVIAVQTQDSGIAVQTADEDLSNHTHEGWTKIAAEPGGTVRVGNAEWTTTTLIGGTKYYVLEAGNYYLDNDISLGNSIRIAENTTVTLCLNRNTITGGDGKDAVIVAVGATLNLTDCEGAGEITHKTEQEGRGVNVLGTFNMYGGSITGNSTTTGYDATYNGGGVYVYGSSAAFTMYGGSITGNKATRDGGGVYVDKGKFKMTGGTIGGTGENSANTAQYGGGVYVYGNSAAFTMYGSASITGNTANCGGGVFVGIRSTFTMTGGTIGGTGENSANTAKKGGGVYVSGTFNMSGDAAITGNKINESSGIGGGGVYVGYEETGGYTVYGEFTMSGNAKITGNTATLYVSGGGVYVYGTGCSFTMTGGTIGGTDENDGNTANCGGGVCVLSGKFTMSGGSIAGNTAGYGGGVYVGDKSTFTMSGTASITGNSSTKQGGGVYVSDKSTFTMSGGTIANNIGDTGVGDISTGRGGGGVLVAKGGTFTMSGGSITGNEAQGPYNNYYCGDGGGVYVSGAFNMSGGSITGNHASDFGGGVYVSGTFNMSGGTIGGTGEHDGNKAYYGGGVYVISGCKFTMSGDAGITGNTAGYYGGGVYVARGDNVKGNLTMSDNARITGNTATQNGGGVYMSGSITVSGAVNITGNSKGGTQGEGNVYTGSTTDNLYLYYKNTVAIGNGGLTDGAKIGVGRKDDYIKDVLTDGWSTYMSSAAPSDYFTSDAEGYAPVLNDGEVYLVAHTHKWTYALKEGTTDTITATCKDCVANGGKDYTGSITIKAPAVSEGQTLTYDGSAKPATVTKTQWSGDAAISYQVKTVEGTWDNLTSTTAPTDTGTYKASITLTGADESTATASVEYTIAKATPKASDFTFTVPSALTYDGSAKAATAALKSPKTGAGEITVKYLKEISEGFSEVLENAKDAGDYTVKIDVADGGNYNAASDLTDSNWEFTIQKADYTGKDIKVEQTVLVTAAGQQVTVDMTDYLPMVNGVVLDGAKVSGVSVGTDSDGIIDTEGFDHNGNEVTFNFKEAGDVTNKTATINVTITSTNYNDITATITVHTKDKDQATVTISGLPETVTYGDTFTLTPTATAKDGETVLNGGTWTWDYNTEYFKQVESNANTDVLKLQAIKSGSGRITVDYSSDTHYGSYYNLVDIQRKTLTQDDLEFVENHDSFTKAYDGTADSTATVRIKDSAKVKTGDTLPTVSGTCAYNSKNVAEANRVTYTTAAAVSDNYVLPASLTLTHDADITKATPTVSGSGTASGTYGQKLSEVTVSGLTAALNGNTVAGSWALTDETSDTLDTVTLNGSTINYTAVFTPENTGNFTTAEATVAVSIAPKAGGRLGTVNLMQKFTDTAEQTYTPDWTRLPDNENWTYRGTAVTSNSSITVSKSDLSVDGKTLTYQISGGQADDTVTFTLTATCTSGHYEPFTITLTVTLTDRDPQTFTFNEEAVNKSYGDSDFTFAATGAKTSVTYSSSDESVATVDNTGKVTIKGVGTTTIAATAAQSDAYSKAEKSYTLTVGKKPITAPAADQTVYTYNDTEQTYQLTANDDYTIIGNKQINANETGYAVKVELKDKANTKWAGEGDDTADKTYTFVIKKATVTVTAKDKSTYVNGTAPALTDPVLDTDYTVSGLFGNNTLTGTLALNYVDAEGNVISPDMTKTGETVIRPSGVSAGDNYTVNFVDGKLSVTNRPSSGGSSSGSSSYPVAVSGKISNGSVSVSPKSARKGDTVTVTATPDKGYTLETITVLDKDGKELKLTDKGNGKYTFTMPASKVTVQASFLDDNTMLNFFVDVKTDDYFYDAVLWAAQNGITAGTDAVHFSPSASCTRAQIVTFLWCAAGSPEPKNAGSFADVSADSYYAKAVAWAVENGITGGTGDGKFSPNATCTREQAVTLLYRASGSPAVSGGSAFSDVAANAYYANAVAWAEQNGVTGGIGNGKFGTGSDCTRAQIVTFLYRAYQGK